MGRSTARASNGGAFQPVDILSHADVERAIRDFVPDAVFYLAAAHSSSQEGEVSQASLLQRSFEVNTIGLGNFLAAIEHLTGCRLFYASSSMVFGDDNPAQQTEDTPLRPTTIYGISKAAGMRLCQYFRTRGTHASTGILYNHESPQRRASFLPQKIARGAVAISRGLEEKLVLGDCSARVDWGYAPDFVDAMIRIATQPVADDYIVATGELHSVGEFAELAFREVGLSWRDHVVEDSSVLTRRRTSLCGDASRLRERTGWRPSVSFEEMVAMLVAGARSSDAA